jgi:hypothetical protein
MEEVLDVLLVDSRRAFSLDEISHLVYDPFPALISVDLPSPLLEIEGFEQLGERSVAIGGLGLWRSLVALEESWVSRRCSRAWSPLKRPTKTSRASTSRRSRPGRARRLPRCRRSRSAPPSSNSCSRLRSTGSNGRQPSPRHDTARAGRSL